jgi:hypothetical protein
MRESTVISKYIHSPTSLSKDESFTTSCRMNLYECTLSDPPEREEHPRVVKIAELITSFEKMPLEKVESKYISSLGTTVCKVEFTVNIRFRAEEGTLQFSSTAYGTEYATTSVKFNRDR